MAVLNFDISTRTAKFMQGMNKVDKRLKGVRKSIVGIGSGLSGIAPVVGVGGLAILVKQSLNAQEELLNLNKRLGVSVEGLSQLQYAAEQTGVSARTFNMALQRMARRTSEAAAGTGEAKAALIELGVSAKKLNDLRPDEQFKVLSDAIMKVEAPADRLRIAFKLFDSEGASVLQTMEGGSKALKEYADEADRLGVTVTGIDAQKAKDANDAFTRMGGSVTGLANDLALSLAPAMVNAANFLANKIPAAVEFTQDAFEKLSEFINGSAFSTVDDNAEKLKAVSLEIAAIEERLAGGRVRGETVLKAQLNTLLEQQRIYEGIAQLAPELAVDQTAVETMDSYATATNNAALALQNFAIVGSPETMQAQKEGMEEMESSMGAIFDSIHQKRDADRRAEIDGQKSKLTQIASIQATGSKKATAITKSAALADATINGYKAIQAALAAPPGFPFNLPQVAITTAMQAANLAAIGGVSFAGGGFTGSGSRIGGIDGQGGFPAILHPNETVIDHTKGQGGGSPQINLSIQAMDGESVERVLYNQRGYLMSLINDALNNSGQGALV